MALPLVVDFGPEICGALETSTTREWLVTNGLGGFACGTVSGVLTRRYHGLLVASLPRIGRTLLVSKLDEILRYDGRSYELGANRWMGGAIAPDGFRWIQRFHLAGTTPVWSYQCADALVEKRVWMQDGANTTYVRYDLTRASAGPADLEIKALVNYRDFHAITRAGQWRMDIAPAEHGLRIVAGAGAIPFYVLSDRAQAEPRHEWYRDYDLAAERERGLDDREDHLFAGIFRGRLSPGESITFALSTDRAPSLDGRSALAERVAAEEKLLASWVAAHPQASLEAPPWIWQLALAAAQFPVRRSLRDAPDAWSVVAGYPWFSEWSRDTMIALPGLAMETGRYEVARSILQGFPRFAKGGLLPNTFSETGEPAAYNTADASLWYFQALRQYVSESSDLALARELFETLASMIDSYRRGTRFGIRMDPADGLLRAGEPGAQLTWMDAKVGDRVITARAGKPVEVNALWYNALRTMAGFALQLGKPAEEFIALAKRVQENFARYWNPEKGCCFDVLDGADGHDSSMRPNQIFAVSLPETALNAEQCKAVVDVCARQLLTPHGLRTLDPADPRYCGHYGGSSAQRDAAYHQGTVWAWLLGPFVLAYLRVYGHPQQAFAFLEPMAHQLSAYGLGSVGEIFDGEAPFHPRGTMAQAWSVAEILRAWRACYDARVRSRKDAQS
jgi:predicted glycogen debranching enzyme